VLNIATIQTTSIQSSVAQLIQEQSTQYNGIIGALQQHQQLQQFQPLPLQHQTHQHYQQQQLMPQQFTPNRFQTSANQQTQSSPPPQPQPQQQQQHQPQPQQQQQLLNTSNLANVSLIDFLAAFTSQRQNNES
jgi:hypothetical protein